MQNLSYSTPSSGKPHLHISDIGDGQANGHINGILSSPNDSDNAERHLAALSASLNGQLSMGASTNGTAKTNGVDSGKNRPTSEIMKTDPILSAALANTISPCEHLHSAAASFGSYKSRGPAYPPSLEKLIMDYHHRNSKSWQLALDIGAGSGAWTPTMTKYFRHVHVSDPDAKALNQTRLALSAWIKNRKSRGRFTFSTTTPDLGNEMVADGTVDMVVITGGAHFVEPEAMIRNASQALAPNGTLAIVNHSPLCRVVGSPAVEKAVQKLFDAWGNGPYDVMCGDSESKARFSLGLDFIALPIELFSYDKTRRITINSTSDRYAAFQVPGVKADVSATRMRNSEQKREYGPEDEYGRGWRQEVGPEFFRSMTVALLGANATTKFEKNFKEIEQAVHATSPNGILFTVEWTAAVVLATRR